MTKRNKILIALKVVRSISAFCMIGALVAGALGYGSDTKLIAAAGTGMTSVAVFAVLKASHLLA